MSTQEVSTNNHGGEDVPQPNELVLNEEGTQNILEAVEEPPTKRSKIDKIPKTVVLEALDGLREADERLLSLYEETLQMKDDEINLLRKQITDYERERRKMLKYIDKAKSTVKTLFLNIIDELAILCTTLLQPVSLSQQPPIIYQI